MLKRLLALVVLLAGLLSGFTLQSHAGPLREFDVGHWLGYASNDPETGEFVLCSVSSGYGNGTVLTLTVARSKRQTINLIAQDWPMTPGAIYDVTLSVDGRDPLKVKGEAFPNQSLFIDLPAQDDLFERVRHGYRLDIVSGRQRYALKLNGAAQALAAVYECVDSAGKRPVTAAAQPQQQPAPGSSQTGSSDSKAASIDSLRIEAKTVLADILTQASITGYHIFTREEIPNSYKKHQAFWAKGGDTSGTFDVLPDADGTLVTALVNDSVAEGAKACKGKFASDRDIDAETGQIVGVVNACQGTDENYIIYYGFLNRPAGGLYFTSLFSTVAQDGTGSGESDAADEAVSRNFRAAAHRLLGRHPAQQ